MIPVALAALLAACGGDPDAPGRCGAGAAEATLAFGDPPGAEARTTLILGPQGGCHVAVGVWLAGAWADRVTLSGAVTLDDGAVLEARRRLRVTDESGRCLAGPFPVVAFEPEAAVGPGRAVFQVEDELGNQVDAEAPLTLEPNPACQP